jgi:D-methionine transport system ATP-binding protein
VLTRTLREHGVDGTVVYGGITEVAERPYGSLTVELVGDGGAVEAAVAALRAVTWVDDHGRADA